MTACEKFGHAWYARKFGGVGCGRCGEYSAQFHMHYDKPCTNSPCEAPIQTKETTMIYNAESEAQIRAEVEKTRKAMVGVYERLHGFSWHRNDAEFVKLTKRMAVEALAGIDAVMAAMSREKATICTFCNEPTDAPTRGSDGKTIACDECAYLSEENSK